MKCHTQLYKFEQCIIISYNERSATVCAINTSTKTPKLSVPPQVAQTVGPQRHQQRTTNTQLFHKDMHRRPQKHQLLIQRLLRPLQLQRQLLLKHKVKHNAIRNLKK